MHIEYSGKESLIFKKIARASEQLSVNSYLIGGFVRDKLLNRPTKDADILCIGDGIHLANEVAELFNPKPTVAYFKNFGTAQIKIPEFEIEFVGARKESYSQDSRKPVVETGTLEDDLNRRDFTINTLAVSLNKNNYGELIDAFSGLKHLEQRV
ncbi:MAG: tRNA nucleotidyltransferase, partial [Parafilimonas sp.]